MPSYEEQDSSREKIRIILGNWIHILSFVNTLANSFRSQQTDAWKERNRGLFDYYRTLAPRLPNSFREMEPLFLVVICACNAGLYHEALHKIYILGFSGGTLFLLLTSSEPEVLLTVTRGFVSPGVRVCQHRVESFCHSLNRPLVLHSALMGQWRCSLLTEKLTTTMQIAERISSLAQEQNEAALMLGASRALACTHYFLSRRFRRRTTIRSRWSSDLALGRRKAAKIRVEATIAGKTTLYNSITARF